MPTPTNGEQQHAVATAVKAVDDAYNRGDLAAILEFYESNAVVVTDPNGNLARGKAEVRRAFEQILPPNGSVRQMTTRVIEADGIALFTSHWIHSGIDASGNTFAWQHTATTVFRKQGDGQWRALIDNPFGPAILGSLAPLNAAPPS